jgi:hypothetical protein
MARMVLLESSTVACALVAMVANVPRSELAGS